ncbi:ARM repeat-containing protein [Schizophyllum commune H4-8]|uniref:SYO1-like TPR repeats domain-containing protein n=1 Tax=Schizophyllum commune (strain H4-8 / FGSC 9210) TaxID=578458 RepID=D8PR76_SCHCM|nr:ARM repeat-containing protein [Schizophyllum commune H4-8]KAI5898062.1 ARM repeat-containing protein [Schizophyllum commune H4-8]
MGKSQKKRSMRRHNPVRVPDSHLPKGLASASSSSSKTEAILPIIQKMESVDGAERKWACVAVSNLIQNDPSTRRLLQGKNVVGALITRLTDAEEEVVVEAMGSLRNLCIDGGYDICAEMYNKNILTPLKTFVPKISTTLSQYLSGDKATPENARKLVYEFADSVITTLWCLSETNNKALNAINEINLVPFLMSFLGARDKLPIGTVTSAAQCLYVLTDDNFPAILETRSNPDYVTCLLEIAKSGSSGNGKDKEETDTRPTTLRVLAAGILRNLAPLPPPTAASFVDIDKEIVLPLLQPVVAAVDLQEVAAVAQRCIAQIEAEPPKEGEMKHGPKSDHQSAAEVELGQLEAKLRTLQLALEILTGTCATLPDPEPEEHPTGDEEDEEDEDGDVEVDDAADTAPVSSDVGATRSFLPALVPSLLALAQPTALSFPPLAAPAAHPPTTSALSAIHISALECLNNIFLGLAASPSAQVSSDLDAGRRVWTGLWSALGAVGTEFGGLGQERRREMWDICVGVLWGAAIVWKGTLVPGEQHVQVLTQYCDSAADERTRVKCIGALECLAQCPEAVDANRVIAEYLLTALPSGGSPPRLGTEPALQAASALIDIYSDENMPYDVNFRQGGYLARLVDSVEGMRKLVKAIDRKKERDLRRHGEEVRDNLVAFIEYRRELGL